MTPQNELTDTSRELIDKNPNMESLFAPVPIPGLLMRPTAEEFSFLKQLTSTSGHSLRLLKVKAILKSSRYPDVPLFVNNLALPFTGGLSEKNFFHSSWVQAGGKSFIASQAPSSQNVFSFLSLIVHNKVKLVITLCDLNEIGQKCFQFWPDEEEKIFESFRVSLVEKQEIENLIIRKVKVCQEENTFEFLHVHLTEWIDHSVLPPHRIQTFAFFLKLLFIFSTKKKEEKITSSSIYYSPLMIKPLSSDESTLMRIFIRSEIDSGPILVHCAGGIGRTGTLLAGFELISQFNNSLVKGERPSVSVMEAVRIIREQRSGAVSEEAQFAFLYRLAKEF